MIPPLPRLSDYDVSGIHGFLPTEPPIQELADPYYAPWETVIKNLQSFILSRRLRAMVECLPVLDTAYLHTEPEWRRAYMLLAFLTHAYIWGGDSPRDVVPPSLSVPFMQTSEHLGIPPVATYAATVLWNWRPMLPQEPIDNVENLATLSTFTGALDESWFYLISTAIEARAAPTIPLLLSAVDAARYDHADTVIEVLRQCAEIIDELGGMLTRMYESCDPHVFYHRIRPYLAGSKNMADAGLPNGVLFDQGRGDEEYVQYSGGSNAQSSIFQFLDIMLGIEHRPTGSRASDEDISASETEAPVKHGHMAPSHSFIQDMRRYMPARHAAFLAHAERVANIREYVESHRSNRALTIAFDACLAMLRSLRDKHIQMVSRYIIVKSRESRSLSRSISPRMGYPSKVNLATASSAQAGPDNNPLVGGAVRSEKRQLRGTGGTALIQFLKQARDETGEPAIDAWARRLLGNGPADAQSGRYSLEKGGLGGVRMSKMAEQASGTLEIVGLAGTWSVDDSEGGICHW